MRTVNALGIMSGTSLDGIDISLIQTDGHSYLERCGMRHVAFPADVRSLLRNAIDCAAHTTSERLKCEPRLPEIQEAETIFSKFVTESIYDFLSSVTSTHYPEVIGCHGQTIVHRPSDKLSIQIINFAELAKASNAAVVYDFRNRDIMNGGQGAPLAPFYHFTLSKEYLYGFTSAFVNIGGIANVTWVNQHAQTPEEHMALFAFDVGPGNTFVDYWSRTAYNKDYDYDGEVAVSGKVHKEIVDSYIEQQEFFKRTPPKSLDINDLPFPEDVRYLSCNDAMATIASITVAGIISAREWFPKEPDVWVLCGGGSKNAFFRRNIAQGLHNASVRLLDEFISEGCMFVEAECFAYLAARRIMELPLSSPTTTGCASLMTSGEIYYPDSYTQHAS